MTSTPIEPNEYTLTGDGARITYTTSSINGQPQLRYQLKLAGPAGGDPPPGAVSGVKITHQSAEHVGAVSGDEIEVTPVPIGTLVTVTLSATPDLQKTTLTLLLPAIHLDEPGSAAARAAGTATFQTQAILTRHRSSIGGPRRVQGVVESYQFVPLTGTARLVHP